MAYTTVSRDNCNINFILGYLPCILSELYNVLREITVRGRHATGVFGKSIHMVILDMSLMHTGIDLIHRR